jgi:hypothetical protein
VILRAHFFDLLTVKIWCRIITQVPAVGTQEWWMPGRRKQLPWPTRSLSSLRAFKERPGCFPLFIVLYTFHLITFLNQQVESFKRHQAKHEVVILNFVTYNVLQLQHKHLQLLS